jgi:predicted RNase H-like HicB family nuclease
LRLWLDRAAKIINMDMVLTAVYEEVPESEGGGYVAYTEELPGAITEGDTLEEARENLRDAIEVLLLTRKGEN